MEMSKKVESEHAIAIENVRVLWECIEGYVGVVESAFKGDDRE